jgi:hypothetical protein
MTRPGNALDLLARESMRDFQELADEAFADLLRKHGRDLRWIVPLVILGNVVVATTAWTIVWLVMK